MLKLRRFVIVFLVSIMCLVIAPFHVYAYSIDQSHVRGVNFDVVDIIPTGNTETDNNSNTYFQVDIIFKHEVVFDTAYLGYVTGSLSGNYYAYTSSGQYQSMTTTLSSKSYYINGYSFTAYSTAQVYLQQNMISQFSAISRYGSTFTLAGSNVYDINYTGRMLEDIEDILYNAENIYTSVYDAQNGTIIEQVVTTNDILNDVYDMLGQINVQLDDVLYYLENHREYNFPIESYNFIARLYFNGYQELTSFNSQYPKYYTFPVFEIPNGNYFASMYVEVPSGTVSYVDFVGYFFLSSTSIPIANENMVWISQKTLSYFPTAVSGYNYCYLMHIRYRVNSSTNIRIRATSNFNFTPIYLGYINENYKPYHYVSDSFAQQFDLIDSSHQEQLDDSTSHMQNEFNDMFDYEDDFNSDMNNALQNIDVNFDVGNQLGSKFLASADWVRQQYNTLTSNTPFGTVLSFSLLLGLALLIIGKAVR